MRMKKKTSLVEDSGEGAGCAVNSFPNNCGQGDVMSQDYVEWGENYERTSMIFAGTWTAFHEKWTQVIILIMANKTRA